MRFCTQCGNTLEANARFCGKCGMKTIQSPDDANPADTEPQSAVFIPNKKKTKYNIKVIGVLIAAVIVAMVYMNTPKQLTEQEYEALAIELLVKSNLAMENYMNSIDFSGVDVGWDPYWSDEFKQLVEPANELENYFVRFAEILEDVKPPIYYEYEHVLLLKALAEHKNMASNIGLFMETGEEEYIEAADEYERRAEDYLEKSIFLTEQYEEKIRRMYSTTILD
ncbi:zinc-ribbon domain-containing protein [Planococcus sp. X10-3]|uniref:zinc-ribbon domain-containing protein n=1 Tax=Planococcus sp. X10-3 TaxID=3061240 RepID=UPI003BB0D96F